MRLRSRSEDSCLVQTSIRRRDEQERSTVKVIAAYYNEIDNFAAQWLRELIKAGHIAPGEVDERSIEDVTPNELLGFTQCHFFAGIGVWSYALRQAGWADDRPVWTGSCPCQPFSSAGKGRGLADERHLWPAFHHLIRECRPGVVFGEQVANKAGEAWFDLVRTDLEAEGYAAGLSVFPACGVGAPHLRKRLYWMADATGEQQQHAPEQDGWGDLARGIGTGSMADARLKVYTGKEVVCVPEKNSEGYSDRPSGCGLTGRPGPTNGHWRDVDWLSCRDGKWRPVEPGTFPLVDGATARVGRLRGYGNAIVAPQAQAFIESFIEHKDKR